MKNQQKTQISFVSNKDLKERAMQKAKEDGITLKALFITAMKLYVNNDLSFSLKHEEEPTQHMIDSSKEAKEECKRGDVSPGFHDAESAIAWLDDLNQKDDLFADKEIVQKSNQLGRVLQKINI